METTVTGSSRRATVSFLWVAIAALVFVFAVSATTASAAHAPGVSGNFQIKLDGKSNAGKKLGKNKVKFSPKNVTLDVTSVNTSGSTTFNLAGKKVKFTSKQVIRRPNGKKVKKTRKTNIAFTKVTFSDKSWFTVKVGSKTVNKAFSAPLPAIASNLGGSTFNTNAGKLKLENAGAKAIAKALKLKNNKVKAGVAGTVPATITVESDPVPYPYAGDCDIEALDGGNGADWLNFAADPKSLPDFEVAQTVAGEDEAAVVDWGFIDSFRGYVIGTPPPGQVLALDDAEIVGSAASPTAEINHPVTGGAFFGGEGAGTLVAESQGTVLYCKSGHYFNFAFRNPTVVLDGADSRLSVEVGANISGNWSDFQRVDIADLDISEVEAEYNGNGKTVTFADIPAVLSADGYAVLGGALSQYSVGSVLDDVTVTVDLEEQPFAGSCVLNHFASPALTVPESVNFSLASDPTFVNEPTGNETGAFEWGLRRALRASVASGGADGANPETQPGNPDGPFPLFGGVIESHPGNMGGGASPAPTGGLGKFFSFPSSSVEYEQGETPAGDKLRIKSDGSLVFCNRRQGGYGIALSHPTLIIDGENSRIRGNVYSFRFFDGSYYWAGGRVDLVSLDTSEITPTVDGNTTTWTDIPVSAVLPGGAQALTVSTAAALDDPVTVRITQ